ncbi:MAG: hypothetical protein ACR2JI_15470 [Mycobacterium sp.]
MNVIAAAAAVAGIAAATLGSAGYAAADSTNAADIVAQLQGQGYTVQFNMPSEMNLSRCTVSGVSGLTVMMMSDGSLMSMMAPPGSRGTAYVTLNCPDSNN